MVSSISEYDSGNKNICLYLLFCNRKFQKLTYTVLLLDVYYQLSFLYFKMMDNKTRWTYTQTILKLLIFKMRSQIIIVVQSKNMFQGLTKLKDFKIDENGLT